MALESSAFPPFFMSLCRRLQKDINFSASFDAMPLQLALRASSWVLQAAARRKTLTISSGDCILTWNKMSLDLGKIKPSPPHLLSV